MAEKPQESDPQGIAATLMRVVGDIIKNTCHLELTKDPEFVERDIIEYQSRMRISSLEKFNGPCFVSSISFYLTEEHLEQHDACGTMVLYLEEELAGKILKTLEAQSFDEEDSEMVSDRCGKLCSLIADNFKNELSKMGHKDLRLSELINGINDIPQGVEFPYNQYKFYETHFDLWKKKAIVVDAVMAPFQPRN
jgi:hypothetical protein